MNQEIIEKVRDYVQSLYRARHDKGVAYHTLDHTIEVTEAAEKIGKASNLPNDQLEDVIIAAWFHDTGYLFTHENHEEQSVKVAGDFLKEIQFPQERIGRIQSLILATHMTHEPVNAAEEVLRDADYINLASTDNLKQAELLKNEMINHGAKEPTEEEWLTAELKFLLNHRYYSAYGKNKLESKKEENIKKIRKKLKRYREQDETILEHETATMEKEPLFKFGNSQSDGQTAARPDSYLQNNINAEVANNHNDGVITEKKTKEEKKEEKEAKAEMKEQKDELKKEMKEEMKEEKKAEKEKEKDKEKDKSGDEKDKKVLDKQKVISIKEFDAIYRLIATNHVRMNAIADRKANIMLTLNGIIISITMSVVAANAQTNPRLIIPTSILIFTCLLTIIFAALSTRPKVTTGTVDKQDIIDKKANLLFFGNFSKMEFEDYDWGMRKLITDQEYLHNSMILDFYNLGKVLDLKYKYLRICYNVFMVGVILSVVSITILIAMGY